MSANVNKRGRKKTAQKTPQINTISNYFDHSKTKSTEAKQISKIILDDLLLNVVYNSESIVHDIISDVLETVDRKTQQKHSGYRVSKKTVNDWKAKFPWLVVSEGEQFRLSCSVCTNAKTKLKLTSVWANEGSPNIQISSITRHNDSVEHNNACKENEKQKHVEMLEQYNEGDHEDVTVSKEDLMLFNTVYFAAKAEIPSDTINGLLSLQAINGVDIRYTNLSWDTISGIQKSISHVLTTDIVHDIKASKVFGIMLDESTDVTVDKRLSICVRYVKAGESVIKFLCNVPIADGCAHTIVNCVADEFEKLGLSMSACTSLATDGAASMMGKHTGAGKQIQAKYAPFCVQTHCVAHRLNLACTDSIKKNDFFIQFRDKFNALYYFISASSLRTLTLKKIQQLLQEPELSIKEPHSIRWLGLKNAVEAVFESYASVLATLSKYAAEKNPVAKGLFKYFNSYKVAIVTAFILDIHTELAILSCQFQKQNLLFSEIQPMLDGTLAKIENLNSTDGEALGKMKESIMISEGGEATFSGEKIMYSKTMDAEFETLRKDYVKRMKKNIKNRFQRKDADIFEDFSKVLEPVTVNGTTDTESEEALSHLATFYGYEKRVHIDEGNLIEGADEQSTIVTPLLDPEKLKAEWPRLKGMVKGSYAKLDTSQLCKRLLLLHQDIMPSFAMLAGIALCMQLTSVECERSFSTQNRLKNKFRASLGSEKLEILLKISMIGPAVGSYDLSPAISHWLKKKRRKGRLFARYKPRAAKRQKLC